MPDMSDRFNILIDLASKIKDFITNKYYYRVNILNVVINFQLADLDSRFTALELFVLSATFDPRNNFQLPNLDSRFSVLLMFAILL